MKLIVAGTRDFSDYELLCTYLDKIRVNDKNLEIISGGARGADSLGERYARQHRIPLKIVNADWESFGRSAGYKRNLEMGQYADKAIVFWDNQSKGTKNMITIMKQLNKQCYVVTY